MRRVPSSGLGRMLARLLVALLLLNGLTMPVLSRGVEAGAGHHHSDSSPRHPSGHHLDDCCAFCAVHCVTHLRPDHGARPVLAELLREAPSDRRLPAGPALAPLPHRLPLSQGPPSIAG